MKDDVSDGEDEIPVETEDDNLMQTKIQGKAKEETKGLKHL
jgi:hypothetical protein